MPDQNRPGIRELGVRIGQLEPGSKNCITDVPGVRVGHTTVIDGDGVDSPAIRTGVTAIWPHDKWPWYDRVYAGTAILNGYGEIVGITAINEWGLLSGPILLSSSSFIGLAFDAAMRWISALDPEQGVNDVFLPVVSECDDSYLNDVKAFGLTADHVAHALESASTDTVTEGCVGSATGLQCFDFKGGIGTSSRRLTHGQGGHNVVGVLVSTNFGSRSDLIIAGVPVGEKITELMPDGHSEGSCVVIVATDVPMLPHQLRRVALRAGMGLARAGSIGANGSGELVIAFSTAQTIPRSKPGGIIDLTAVLDGQFWRLPSRFDPVFRATIEATEEAVCNALFKATTLGGRAGHVLHALPLQRTMEILEAHGRLERRSA
jgi:D-aminopeptidase